MISWGRIAILACAVEVGAWVLATALRPGSWRYNISDLYAAGAPQPWLVMAGETAFGLALAALVVLLRRALPATDQRLVGCALLVLASAGTLAGGIARNTCEESVPRCEGKTFVTTADWVHAVGSIVEILGIAGAAIVLAAALPRPLSSYSWATGGVVLASLIAWEAVPYPWVGTAERVLALVLVGWVVVLAQQAPTRSAPTSSAPRPVAARPRPR